jgi:hypothetical protein
MKLFIPIVLLGAILCSCGKSSTGIVVSSAPIFGSEDSNDTIHVAPTGAVLEYSGESDPAKPRVKVKFNGTDGFIERGKFVFNATAAVDSSGAFVVYDKLDNGRAYIHQHDITNSRWADVGTLDTDTVNITVAALADALDNGPYNDETNISLAKIAAAHSAHPGLQVLKVDLSEVPDESIVEMQKKFHLLINKSNNEIITTRNTTASWINSYTRDILKSSADANEAEYYIPRYNYHDSYIRTLPEFVKVFPKSNGGPNDADPLRSFLLFRMDRSPDNVKRLYDLYKPVIVNQITSGLLQNVKPDINKLIVAYDFIVAKPDHRTVISDISKKIAQWDKKNVDAQGYGTSMYTLVDQSSIYEPIIDIEKYDPERDFQGIWYSSFWTRRFAEGNEKVVYDILKDLSNYGPEEFDADGKENPDDESNETELITCTFQDYGLGDCAHIIFDCGDYGDADINALSEEGQQLWADLDAEDGDDVIGNPKYVGKRFSIKIGTTRGPACNEGQGGEGVVPKILEFKLLD